MPSGYVKIAIEKWPLKQWICPLKIVIFHSYVNVYQRVYPEHLPVLFFCCATQLLGAPATPTSSSSLRKMGFSIVMGDPQQLYGLFHGKSKPKMDDNWGCPHVRKPPYVFGIIGVEDTVMLIRWDYHGIQRLSPTLWLLKAMFYRGLIRYFGKLLFLWPV